MKNLRIICVVLISIMPPPYEASNHGDNSPTREVQKIKQIFYKVFCVAGNLTALFPGLTRLIYRAEGSVEVAFSIQVRAAHDY